MFRYWHGDPQGHRLDDLTDRSLVSADTFGPWGPRPHAPLRGSSTQSCRRPRVLRWMAIVTRILPSASFRAADAKKKTMGPERTFLGFRSRSPRGAWHWTAPVRRACARHVAGEAHSQDKRASHRCKHLSKQLSAQSPARPASARPSQNGGDVLESSAAARAVQDVQTERCSCPGGLGSAPYPARSACAR